MTLALHGKSRQRRFLLLAVALLALFGSLGAAVSTMFGSSARAASVAPVLTPGNPSCTQLGYAFGFKIDGWDGATFPTSGYPEYLSFTLTNGTQHGFLTSITSGDEHPGATIGIRSQDGLSFDWTASLAIDAVIVKGGPNANVYAYDPAVMADTVLTTPGGAFAVSHVEFCFSAAPTSTVTDLHDAEHNSIALGSSVPFGSTIHDSATVTPAAATGTVTFSFFTNGACEGEPQATSPALPLVAGSVDATGFAQGPLDAGDYSFQATFTPDNALFQASTSGCEPFRIAEDPQAVVSIDKTVDAEFDTRCTWDIDKTVTPTVIDMFTGESQSAGYTVTISRDDCDTAVGYRISGEITIFNGSPADSFEVTAIADVLGGTVDCNGAEDGTGIPFTVGPEASVVCTYQVADATGEETTNTVTATVDGLPIESPAVDVTYVASGIVIDSEVTVEDSLEGSLGAFTNDATIPYSREFACDEDEGEHPNTATFTTSDTATQGSASASVTVNCLEPEPTTLVTELHDADENVVPVGSSVAYNSTIHDSATVTPATATGAVTFSFFLNGACEGEPEATSEALALVDGYVDATGFAQGPLAGGDYSFQATYTPDDPAFAPSTADCEPFRVRENPQAVVSVAKTVEAVFDAQCAWEITKTANPASLAMFAGDSAGVTYTVEVMRDDCETQLNHRISGSITVVNNSDVDTYTVTAIDDDLGGELKCDASLPADLGPGESILCTYEILDATGEETTNTATAMVDGMEVESLPVDVTFAPSGIVVDAEITVEDTFEGSLGAFTGDGSATYSRTFTCDADEGDHDNTATFTTSDTQTEDSASATVTVDCYEIEVTKDAETSLERTWTWTIEKTGDQSELMLEPGQTSGVNYTVGVSAVSLDSGWAVSGVIRIHNPAPIDATIADVSDVVSPDVVATVDCGVTFPYVLAAGETLECDYSAELADGEDRTNTATATRQNSPDGTTDVTATAEVSFDGVTMTEVDECIDVTDDKGGALGTVCADELPATFNYALTVGPYDVCGEYSYVNVASFVASDTGATGSDSWTVAIDVVCEEEGCTLTPGYWKTHSLYGPAPTDDRWAVVGEDTEFFLSGQTYYEVLWSPPKGGNAYYILAHAYIAAELNMLNGASMPDEVQAAFDEATALFGTYTPDDIAALRGAERSDWTRLAGILDRYNNGGSGPGHCDD